MADNVTFQASLTATPAKDTVVGADEIASVLYQRMKLIFGADGTNSGDVSEANPLPVIEDWDYTLYYYDGSGDMEYMCRHSVHGTATSATDWIITKLTYGANGITNREKLPGSVDGRADLGWV